MKHLFCEWIVEVTILKTEDVLWLCLLQWLVQCI